MKSTFILTASAWDACPKLSGNKLNNKRMGLQGNTKILKGKAEANSAFGSKAFHFNLHDCFLT